MKNKQRIGIHFASAADGPNQQRNQHAGLQAFPRYVTGDYQQAAVGSIWQDLEKVAAHLTRREILIFNRQPRHGRNGLRQNHPLHFLRLLHIQGQQALLLDREQQPAQGWVK